MKQNIDTLIEYAESLISSCQNSRSFGYLTKTPSHLIYDIRRIASNWRDRDHITLTDIQYLEHLHTATPEYLLMHVYVEGQWTPWQSSKHKNHNLLRGTQPTKVFGFVNRR